MRWDKFLRPMNFDPFSWRTAWFMGMLADLPYARNSGPTDEIMAMIGGTSSNNVFSVGDSKQVVMNYYRLGDMDVFAFEGTTNQWGSYLNVYFSDERPAGFPEDDRFCGYFSPFTQACLTFISTRRRFGFPTYLCGHSLGGALATILGSRDTGATVNNRSVWTYGSPKCLSENWANRYRTPHFRFAAAGDPVPFMPPPNYTYWVGGPLARLFKWPLQHCGTEVRLQALDFAEIDELEARDAREGGVFRIPLSISAHYMAAYMEAIWAELSIDAKRDFNDLRIILEGNGLMTSPNDIGDLPTQLEQAQTRGKLQVDEVSLMSQLLSPANEIRFRLYTSPTHEITYAELSQITEATFPGYVPQPLPERMRAFTPGTNNTVSETGRVDWELTDDLEPPVIVHGMYATTLGANGVESLQGFFPFDWPQLVYANGFKIHALVSVETAAVQKDVS